MHEQKHQGLKITDYRGEMLKAVIFFNAQALATRRGRSAKLITKLKLQAYGEQYYESISFRVGECKLLVSFGRSKATFFYFKISRRTRAVKSYGRAGKKKRLPIPPLSHSSE